MHEGSESADGGFFGKFGQGGGGAPMRDRFGNVITTRNRDPNAPANLVVDQEEVKQRA